MEKIIGGKFDDTLVVFVDSPEYCERIEFKLNKRNRWIQKDRKIGPIMTLELDGEL